MCLAFNIYSPPNSRDCMFVCLFVRSSCSGCALSVTLVSLGHQLHSYVETTLSYSPSSNMSLKRRMSCYPSALRIRCCFLAIPHGDSLRRSTAAVSFRCSLCFLHASLPATVSSPSTLCIPAYVFINTFRRIVIAPSPCPPELHLSNNIPFCFRHPRRPDPTQGVFDYLTTFHFHVIAPSLAVLLR